MGKITATSPAKIHLIGEYSAIFGKPTIVFPINLELKVTLVSGDKETKKEPFQEAIEAKAIEKYHKEIPTYSIEIESNIPIGGCVGSSAALSSAFTKALLKLIEVEPNNDDIFELALEGEKIFHGFPSGSDLKCVILQKPIWYQKLDDDINVAPFEFKLPDDLKLFLIDSGNPSESTKEMVESVKKDVSEEKLSEFANDQEALTEKMLRCLKNFNPDEFKNLLNEAGDNLVKIGVVSRNALEIIEKVRSIGGGIKINGAGGRKTGSGMMPAFHHDSNKLLELAHENDWNIIPVEILQ